MYRKQIAYFGMVSLKYFLNLDHEQSEQLFIMLLAVAGIVKIIVSYFMSHLAEIKVRANIIFTEIGNRIHRKDDENELAGIPINSIRYSYIEREIAKWHLKKQQ